MTAPPLAGVRVLDAGDFLAVPFCAMTLADWGAEVIKVETLAGDTARTVGEMIDPPHVSAIFASGNRGKRSIAIEMRSPEGRHLVRQLALQCDVVLHNRTTERAASLGLSYDELAAECETIIVGSVTAFGDKGPYAKRGGIDPIAQAMSGMMAATGPAGGEPTRSAVTVVDFGAGLMLAAGVLAALFARGSSGRGAAVTTSLLEVGMLYSSSLYPLASLTGEAPPRLGNRSHPLLADQFATSDGFIVLAVWDERRWRALCRILDLGRLGSEQRYSDNASRLEAYEEIGPALGQAIQRWRTRDLLGVLQGEGIVCAQTYDVTEAARDPHVAAIGALYDEPRLGPLVRMVSSILRVDGTRVQADRPAPRLGQDSREVLTTHLSLDGTQVDDLIDRGVVGALSR